jgi:hypothetical protein
MHEFDRAGRSHMHHLPLNDKDLFAQPCRYSNLAGILFDALDFNYAPEAFGLRRGYFFPEIIDSTAQYVRAVTPAVISWLNSLRQLRTTRLFLLTNSHSDFTEMLLNFAYGANWKEVFDIVVVNSCKPLFFTNSALKSPFHRVNSGHAVGDKLGKLELGSTVIWGNAVEFQQFLEATHKWDGNADLV